MAPTSLFPPDVYPLVASVSVALLYGIYSLKRKWMNDPNVYSGKSARMHGVHLETDDMPELKRASSTFVNSRITMGGPHCPSIVDRRISLSKMHGSVVTRTTTSKGIPADRTVTDVGVVPSILEAAPEEEVFEADRAVLENDSITMPLNSSDCLPAGVH